MKRRTQRINMEVRRHIGRYMAAATGCILWLLPGLPGALLLSGCNNNQPAATEETHSVVADGRNAKEESDITLVYDSLMHHHLAKDSLALRALVSKTCSQQISTPGWQGCCQAGKGSEALYSGNYQGAINAISAAANYFAEAGMWRLQARCRRNLAATYARNAEPQKSNDQYQKSVDLYKTKAETREDSLMLLEVLTQLILGNQSTNHYLDAYRNAELGLSVASQLKDPKNMETFLHFKSIVYEVFGEKEAAHKCNLERLELLSSLPQARDIKRDILFLRLSLADTPEEAAVLKADFQQAATAHQYWFRHQGWFWVNYAELMRDLGQDEPALYWNRKAVDILQAAPDDSQYLWARIRILNHYLKNRQYRAVLKEVPMILPLTRKIQNREMEVTLFDQYSNALFHTGQADSAYHSLRQMMALQDTIRQINPEKNFMRQYMSSIFEKEQEIQRLRQEQEEAVVAAELQRQRLLLGAAGLVLLLLGGLAFALYRNFRAKQHAADTLAAANARLETERLLLQRANTQLRRFSGVITHDILSNLDYILASGNRLNTYDPPKAALKEYFSTSRDTCVQLKNYCVGLLNEVQQQPQTLAPDVTHPMAAIQNTIARFDAALREAGFTVNVDQLSPSLLPPMVVEHLFQNLISNAIRYAATAPAPLLRITEESSAPGQYRWIVEDNGPGISAEKKYTIFEPKQDTNGSVGQHIGLGLLRANLRTHGADLWAEDRDGGGTRWVIRLPVPPKNTL